MGTGYDNVGMPAVRPDRPVTRTAGTTQKPSDSKSLSTALADAGVTSAELFGWQKAAFRRVEAVSSSHVSLDFSGRAVALPKALLPALKVDQWVRFERHGDTISAAVDLRATLRAEARITDLFQVLSRG